MSEVQQAISGVLDARSLRDQLAFEAPVIACATIPRPWKCHARREEAFGAETRIRGGQITKT